MSLLCIRYTKNLSSDKINLSTFRGEGELSNLQLDENVLTELLELPSWLRLTDAWCNHVAFRIHWTKLKSVPITLVSAASTKCSHMKVNWQRDEGTMIPKFHKINIIYCNLIRSVFAFLLHPAEKYSIYCIKFPI